MKNCPNDAKPLYRGHLTIADTFFRNRRHWYRFDGISKVVGFSWIYVDQLVQRNLTKQSWYFGQRKMTLNGQRQYQLIFEFWLVHTWFCAHARHQRAVTCQLKWKVTQKVGYQFAKNAIPEGPYLAASCSLSPLYYFLLTTFLFSRLFFYSPLYISFAAYTATKK